MKLTRDVGEPLVKAFEGCLKKVPGRPGYFTTYVCPGNALTIGWGTTRSDVPDLKPGVIWSQEECDHAFTRGMAKYEKHVIKQLKGAAVTVPQFDALVSWAYNTGGPASSSVWVYARKGNVEETCVRLMRWTKGGGRVLPGLVRRRRAECALYRGNVDSALAIAGTKRAVITTPPENAGKATTRPLAPASEVARRSKGEAATAAGGAAAAGTAGTIQPDPATAKGIPWGDVALWFGVVVFVVGAAFLVRKAVKVNLDWA